MKLSRFVPVIALSLLTACGASAPPPAPTPPSPSVIALANPPGVPVPAPKPAPEPSATRVLDHQHWSIEVPSSWEVSGDGEEGAIISRPETATTMLQVFRKPLDGMTPEQFVIAISVTSVDQLPSGINVTNVKRKLGTFHGHTASITQILTDKNMFVGVFCTVDEANSNGYIVVAIAPMDEDDAKLMGAITQTFTIK